MYVPPPEEKEPWELMKSIFKPRIKEADSRDFWDTDSVRGRPGPSPSLAPPRNQGAH